MNRTKLNPLAIERLQSLALACDIPILTRTQQVQRDRFDPKVINPIRRKDILDAKKKELAKWKKLVKDFNSLESDRERLEFIKRRKDRMGIGVDIKEYSVWPVFITKEIPDPEIKRSVDELEAKLKVFRSSVMELFEIFCSMLKISIWTVEGE